MLQLGDRLRFDKHLHVSVYKFIMLFGGTNDRSQLITSGQIKFVTVQQILARYMAVHNTIRRRNKHAIILVSSILPRVDDFETYAPLINGLNFALQKWCSKSGGSRIYVPTHKVFMEHGKPRRELFAQDGVHPNGVGTDVLENFLQQAFSPQYLVQQLESVRTKMLASLSY